MSARGIYLIGGPSKGTRMRPLTLTTPKPLFPIAGRAMIWHGIQALSKVQGLKEVILIGFYEESVLAPFLREVARDFPELSIRYLREFAALGTAGGLYHFRDIILKGNPDQLFVMNADVCCAYPLEEMRAFHSKHRGVGTLLGVKVPRDTANKYGCIVVDPESNQARHYVEKPESFISEIINGGVYLFDKAIFDEIKSAMDEKVRKAACASEDPLADQTDELRLEQDVLAPMAAARKLFVYQTQSFWRQIKTAGSAVPANALILASYKTTNPTLLRQRSPTVIARSPAATTERPSAEAILASHKPTAEIIEPCFIDETAQIDPSAKIGPNVSIGSNVVVGYGVRVKDSIILDNVHLEKNSCVLHSIVAEDCRIGPWARVEGSPLISEGGSTKQTITILAKDVSVAREVFVRSCIVLPHKALSRSFANEVLL